jgi:hypothetical protein
VIVPSIVSVFVKVVVVEADSVDVGKVIVDVVVAYCVTVKVSVT